LEFFIKKLLKLEKINIIISWELIMNKLTIDNIEAIAVKLKEHYLFSDIPDKNLYTVLSNSSLVELSPNEKLFEKDETYHKGVYLVLDGTILFVNEGALISKMEYGTVLGITTFLGKSSYLVDAIAENYVKLLFLPEICIYKLIGDFESFKNRFYSIVTERLHLLQGESSGKSSSISYKPISSFMTKNVQIFTADGKITEAAKIMRDKNIGSLVIVDKKNNLKGLLSARNIVHNFLSQDDIDLTDKVLNYIDTDPIKVPKDFPAIEVLYEMQSKNKDYAIVIEKDKPIGIISNKDLLRIFYATANTFYLNIENATSYYDLKEIKANLNHVVRNLIDNSRMTSEILPTISTIHLSIQKKVHKLCLSEFQNSTGKKISDLNYAIIIMGSGARKEMMLNPDQDNGYIFGDDLTDDDIQDLMEFGSLFTEKLAYVGYEKCKGDVMVTNPEMSQRLSRWKKQIDMITLNAGDRGFTWSNIIFDMDTFYGNSSLVDQLRDFINKIVSSRPLFLIQMLENETQFKIPITFFGNFIVEKEGDYQGMLNLKSSALTFITDIVRAFSLSNNIKELNTVERAKQLQDKKILSEETVSKILSAYETIVDLALTKEIKDAESNKPITKYINPYELSVYNQNRLKNALGSIAKLLNLGLKYFKGQF